MLYLINNMNMQWRGKEQETYDLEGTVFRVRSRLPKESNLERAEGGLGYDPFAEAYDPLLGPDPQVGK